MKSPLLTVIRNSPILRVADSTPPWRFWDTETPASPDDLWDLESGRSYWLKSRVPFTLKWCGQEYPLTDMSRDGWQLITWRDWVMFEGGTYLTQAHWDWAVSVLERTGLDRLLGVADIRLVKVLSKQGMENLVYYALRGTIFQAWRAVLLLDVPPDPPNAVLAEMIAHECIHMLQVDTGLTDGWRRDEYQAYTISDLLHRFAGSGLEVFNAPGYIQAYELARTDWA